MTSLTDDNARIESWSALSRCRGRLHAFLPRRADALFELCDPMLRADGPVTCLTELSPVAEQQRGHGVMYDVLNQGRLDIGRLRWSWPHWPCHGPPPTLWLTSQAPRTGSSKQWRNSRRPHGMSASGRLPERAAHLAGFS